MPNDPASKPAADLVALFLVAAARGSVLSIAPTDQFRAVATDHGKDGRRFVEHGPGSALHKPGADRSGFSRFDHLEDVREMVRAGAAGRLIGQNREASPKRGGRFGGRFEHAPA